MNNEDLTPFISDREATMNPSREQRLDIIKARVGLGKIEREEVLDEAEEIMCKLRGDTIVEALDGKWAIRIPRKD